MVHVRMLLVRQDVQTLVLITMTLPLMVTMGLVILMIRPVTRIVRSEILRFGMRPVVVVLLMWSLFQDAQM